MKGFRITREEVTTVSQFKRERKWEVSYVRRPAYMCLAPNKFCNIRRCLHTKWKGRISRQIHPQRPASQPALSGVDQPSQLDLRLDQVLTVFGWLLPFSAIPLLRQTRPFGDVELGRGGCSNAVAYERV